MSNQIPDKNYIYKGLLGYNYFPMIALYRDGTPPAFSTEDFTPEVANEMITKYEHTKRNAGFDQIEYRTTRFNKVTRLMHINNKIDSNLEYDCDQYWIPLHELAPNTPKFNRYRGQSGLKFLREKNVHFIKPMNPET